MVDMDKIVSLCKRRGFIFQSSEIYGGRGRPAFALAEGERSLADRLLGRKQKASLFSPSLVANQTGRLVAPVARK
jgi:hypothetical protein